MPFDNEKAMFIFALAKVDPNIPADNVFEKNGSMKVSLNASGFPL